MITFIVLALSKLLLHAARAARGTADLTAADRLPDELYIADGSSSIAFNLAHVAARDVLFGLFWLAWILWTLFERV